MPLVLTARLVTGTYDAATEDPSRRVAEWPPHPLRIFSALVDAAHQVTARPASFAALGWLENLGPPEVWAASRVERSVRSTYVPVNDLPKEPKHTLYPGRVSAGTPKAWPRAVPLGDTVRFVWRDALADEATLGELDRLARLVPYLGRASSPVVVSANGDEYPEPSGAESVWAPDAGGDVALRVPYPGALAALDEAWEAGAGPHEAARSAPYRSPRPVPEASRPTPPPEVRQTPYSDLVTFSIHPRPGLDANSALAVTSQLRRAVISIIGSDVPASVHGHDPDVRHVVWLALPWTLGEHASGQLLGVGVAIPAGIESAARKTILRAILGSSQAEGITRLTLPPPLSRHRSFELRRWTVGGLSSLDPARWVGGAHGSRRWTTVTPVVWDRFTRREADLEGPLLESFSRAGLPDPVPGGLAWSRTPFVRGAAQPRPHQVRREGDPPRPFRHVWVEFAQPVRGPVVVGQMRHFGVGLFAPVDR